MSQIQRLTRWATAAAVCATLGCVSQTEYDAIARANLQLQDRLAASRADRVKGRAQIDLLRQELIQTRQARQNARDDLQQMSIEVETLRSQLDLRAGRTGQAFPSEAPSPATQPVP